MCQLALPNALAPVLVDVVQELATERARRENAEVDRDVYRDWSILLMAEVFTLTRTTRRQAETIARLHTVIREYLTVPSTRRGRRSA